MDALPPKLAERVAFILRGIDKVGMVHCMRLLVWEIDRDSVAGVMAIAPPQVRAELRRIADSMPRTDAEWHAWVDLYVSTALYGPTTTPEQIAEIEHDSRQSTRRGIEALRGYFETYAV